MNTPTLTLSALLLLTTLTAITPTGSAAIEYPQPCEIVRCDIEPIELPCTQMTMQALDPLNEPTSFSCFIPLCDRCVCQWVTAGPDVEAAGQDFTGTVYVGCGVGVWGTFTPGPVDTDAPVCVSFHSDGSPAVDRILASLMPAPVCAAADCTFPPHGLGGVVGDAVTFVESVGTIWCNAAKDAAGTVVDAGRDTCDAATEFLTGGSCPA